jgi:hypothetical protein
MNVYEKALENYIKLLTNGEASKEKCNLRRLLILNQKNYIFSKM